MISPSPSYLLIKVTNFLFKKYSHGSSNSFIQYSPGSSSIMRRTSHSPSTARRSVLRKPSPLLSPKDSSSTNKKEENLLEKNKLLLASTPNLTIKMENEEQEKVCVNNENEQKQSNNKNEDKNGHKKQLSEPCTSTTLTDN
ncbi:unnamed protein product [Meloidogyne enterolobii]|uniref:Uncharacterized protein n=1 Tax=Meloidogyne enterolobii TaxID=390850 RepID=A0ACB1ABY8_MELEN